jgi:diguanylate cyclase (GGDEF)-like protein
VETTDSPFAAARPAAAAGTGGPSARLWWWALAGSALLILAYPLLADGGRLVVYRLLGALAVAGVLGGAHLHGLRPRGPWLLLGLGQAAFVLGDVLRDLDGTLVGPRQAATDAIYLAGYPLLVAGLAVLGRRRAAGRDRAGRLDALIVAIGAGLVVWVFLLAPYATRETLASAAGVKAIAYPVGDLLLLALAVRLFLVAAGRRPRAQWLLGLGLFALLCADALYLALTTGGSIGIPPLAMQIAWLSSYALLGAAVLDPTIRRVAEPGGDGRASARGRLWVLAGASLLAPATLAVETLATTSSHALLVAATSAVLFALVVLRMGGLVRRVEEQSAELARIARTDALTGVPNRRAWDEQLGVELARAARAQAPVCVALLDLDHFKAFNDREGHPAGDAMLRAAATAWRRELRGIDVLARYGGEEFGLILPGCSVSEGAAIVDRLREMTPLGETSSAGVAAWDGSESAYALVARTDRALYAAKRSGRDRTVVADADAAPLAA